MKEFPKYVFIDDSTIRFASVNNIIRSEMDSGMAKTKKNNSKATVSLIFNVTINRNDLFNWFKWFHNDLQSGQRWFLLRHPLFGNVQRFRFLETEIEWVKTGTLLSSTFEIEGYLDV